MGRVVLGDVTASLNVSGALPDSLMLDGAASHFLDGSLRPNSYGSLRVDSSIKGLPGESLIVAEQDGLPEGELILNGEAKLPQEPLVLTDEGMLPKGSLILGNGLNVSSLRVNENGLPPESLVVDEPVNPQWSSLRVDGSEKESEVNKTFWLFGTPEKKKPKLTLDAVVASLPADDDWLEKMPEGVVEADENTAPFDLNMSCIDEDEEDGLSTYSIWFDSDCDDTEQVVIYEHIDAPKQQAIVIDPAPVKTFPIVGSYFPLQPLQNAELVFLPRHEIIYPAVATPIVRTVGLQLQLIEKVSLPRPETAVIRKDSNTVLAQNKLVALLVEQTSRVDKSRGFFKKQKETEAKKEALNNWSKIAKNQQFSNVNEILTFLNKILEDKNITKNRGLGIRTSKTEKDIRALIEDLSDYARAELSGSISRPIVAC